jgi:hypothetical protein
MTCCTSRARSLVCSAVRFASSSAFGLSSPEVMHYTPWCITSGDHMPTDKPRITITMERDTYEAIHSFASVSGESMSSIVTQYLDLVAPSIRRVTRILRAASRAPVEARAGLLKSLERAERTMVSALGAGFEASEAAADQAVHGPLPVAPAARASGRKAQPVAGPTPVPVTRGSGRSKGTPSPSSEGGS